MRELFILCRPRQWVKNGFVLVPLLFSGFFIYPSKIGYALLACALFSVASSATYVLNDLKDVEKDKRHPIKSKSRPLASGQVSVRKAISLLIFLYCSLVLGFLFNPEVMVVIGAYLLINYIYTFYLKNQPVFDIFTIASGFVLRVVAGGVAIDSGTSSWMFIVTLCLALYLASIKRRQELIKSGDNARVVLGYYTEPLLTRYAEMAATCTVVFYSLFVATVRPELILTIPLMLFGLYRYWFSVETNDTGESPTDALLNDRVLQATILVWAALSLRALAGDTSL